ncbi:MAG: hypothetical protein DRI37_09305 [Chloroflexi bacterium]|nr:MAG: hypothetical protein DRI37_09305 [Chloroflexota bacterium]
MKTLLITILFSFSLFASTLSVQNDYELLNQELDALSTALTTEEKVTLYYLVLATHEKITTALALKDVNLINLQEMEQKTISVYLVFLTGPGTFELRTLYKWRKIRWLFVSWSV